MSRLPVSWQGAIRFARRQLSASRTDGLLALSGGEQIAAVRSARRNKDWTALAEAAEALCAVQPDNPLGVESAAQALNGLRRFAEAEAVGREGLARFPDHAGLIKAVAVAAVGQHDWASVSEWAARLRERDPEERAGYELGLRAARSLEQHDAVARITDLAMERFPDQPWAVRANALLALDRRDWRTAEVLALELRERLNHVFGYETGVSSLFQMRRVDDARALLDEGLKRFPDNAELNRHQERLDQWADFVRADEALRAKCEADPDNLSLALKYATHTNRVVRDFFGGPEETLRRLAEVRARHPAAQRLAAAHGKILADLGRFEEAEDALLASGQIETSLDVATAWAELAARREDHEEAVTRYADARSRFPDAVQSHVGLVRALTAIIRHGGADRRDEAEAAAADALARFANIEELHDLHAWIAHHAGDAHAALARWTTALERFPDAARGRFSFRTRVLDASLAAGEAPPAEENVAPQSGNAGAELDFQPALPPAELVARFQNLGSTVFGCEFGGVQRHFGAEPLHLMRWGSCPLPSLIKLIEDDFEGFADEEDARLDIQIRPGAGNEYMLRSLRYTLRLDTFVPVTDTPREQVAVQVRRRTAFLVRKLREELVRPDPADKTLFVYKAYDEHASDEDMAALTRALNRHGPSTLLCVRRAREGKPAGTVEWSGANLITGYLPEFGKTVLGVGLPTQHKAWLAVLSQAYDLWAAELKAETKP